MKNFKQATLEYADEIARLHALSWQHTYRGMLSDDYLNNKVLIEKQAFWHQRLSLKDENLWVWLALDHSTLCAFVCVYLNHDAEWGAFMDNLHVDPGLKRKGLGKTLMQSTCRHIHTLNPLSRLYLWVFENNRAAVDFYLRQGGEIIEKQIQNAPGGGEVQALKIGWKDLSIV